MQNLQLACTKTDEPIDAWLDDVRPRKRSRVGPDQVKRELEQEFLTPSVQFSTEWLNKLQQYAHDSLFVYFASD